ncbi:MAG: hypothetical protein CMM52_08050 [Rhodospirillaceae bacterium]|nr:hypothetical protein [Rhodospirillaceae bacterium]
MNIVKNFVVSSIIALIFLGFDAKAPAFAENGDKFQAIGNHSLLPLLTPVSSKESDVSTVWRGAAEQGNSKAQFMLGLINSQGKDVPPNMVKAHFWFTLSAETFPAGKRYVRSLSNKMSQGQLTLSRLLLKEWKTVNR